MWMVPAGSGSDSAACSVMIWDLIASNESNVFKQYGHEYLFNAEDGPSLSANFFAFLLGIDFDS